MRQAPAQISPHSRPAACLNGGAFSTTGHKFKGVSRF
jgi:hypothetical protein